MMHVIAGRIEDSFARKGQISVRVRDKDGTQIDVDRQSLMRVDLFGLTFRGSSGEQTQTQLLSVASLFLSCCERKGHQEVSVARRSDLGPWANISR